VLDLGVDWTKTLKALDYNIRDVAGCLVTHCHSDHSKAIPKALKYCLDVYSCQEVCDKFEGVQLLPKGVKTSIGSFKVQPLAIKHNVENYAYIITHEDIGKLVFALDCEEFLYKIRDVNHWVIEANHDFDVMLDHALENMYSASASENHLSIDQCVDALSINACDATTTVILAHLSDANSHATQFRDAIKEALGVEEVYIAQKGLDIELCHKN
jgi:phosphoribosyl 1,2-cyclic phosphodiesterase